MKIKLTSGVLCLTLLFAVRVVAQPNTVEAADDAKKTDENKEIVELSPFVVKVEEDTGYFAKNTLVGTRTSERLANIPQNIQIVTRQLMVDTAYDNPIEAMKYGVSGINRRSEFAGDLFLRGFRVRNILKDNIQNAGGNQMGGVPMYDIERIEVIKGPAALLFGQTSSIGGLVNYVSKQPSEKPHSSIKGTLGSFNFYQAELNSTGSLADLGNYRVTLGASNGKGERREQYSKDYFFSGGYEFKISSTSTVTAYYSYYWIDQVLMPINSDSTGNLVRVPEDFSYSESWRQYAHTAQLAQISLKTAFSPTFQSNTVLSYSQEDSDGPWDGIRPGITDATTGLTPRTYVRAFTGPNLSVDLIIDLLKTFDTGPLSHKLGFGGMYTTTEGYSNVDVKPLTPININNPIFGVTPKPAYASISESFTYADSGSIYVQDNVSMLDGKIVVVGGLRYNKVQGNSRNLIAKTSAPTDNGATVKRWGVVLKPIETISLYYNYSESFGFSGSTFIGGPRDGQLLDTSIGENKEFGIKASTPNGGLFATVAVFDMAVTNVGFLVVFADGTIGRDQSGRDTTKGYEVDAGVNLTSPLGPVQAILTYYDGDSKNSVGITPAGTIDGSWSGFVTQSIRSGGLKGVKVGYGAFHKNAVSFANPAPTPWLVSPAYTTMMAFVSYEHKNYRVALNIDNLTDKKFIEGGENAVWVHTNPGRTFKFSVEYRF